MSERRKPSPPKPIELKLALAFVRGKKKFALHSRLIWSAYGGELAKSRKGNIDLLATLPGRSLGQYRTPDGPKGGHTELRQ